MWAGGGTVADAPKIVCGGDEEKVLRSGGFGWWSEVDSRGEWKGNVINIEHEMIKRNDCRFGCG